MHNSAKSRVSPLCLRMIVLFLAVFGGASVNAADLGLSLQPVTTNSATYKNNNIGVMLTFRNTGSESLRVLNHFEPLPVFFAFKIVKNDGTIIDVPGAGKISFYQNSMEYVTLAKGMFFGFQTTLSEVLKTPLDLGDYSVSVTYRNQYGADCFKGNIESNKIHFKIFQ